MSTQSINLAKALPSLVLEAMKALDWQIINSTATQIEATDGSSVVTWTSGQGMTVRGDQALIANLTKTYSAKAVSWAAQRAGWSVKQTGDNRMTVTRR